MSLGIRIRALLAFGLLFVTMFGMLVYFVVTERMDRLAETAAETQADAQRLASEQSTIIERTQQMVSLLTDLHDINELPGSAGCQETLAHLLRQRPRLSNIQVAGLDGVVTCNATPTEHPIDIADRAYFQRALAVAKPVLGEAVVDRSTGKFGLPCAVAIRDRDGQPRGVLVAIIDLQWINATFSDIGEPQGSRLGLIDGTGRVLARYPDPDHWIGRDASHTAFFRTMMASGGTGSAESTGFDGTHRLYGFARFAETMVGPVYLWVGVPRESIIGHIDRKFAWTLLVGTALLVLILMTAWIGTDRLILRPVSMLAHTARRLGEGDHNARTGLADRNDEIGALARAVDQMAVSLMSKNEILRLNRTLRILSQCNKVLVYATSESALLNDICRILVETGNYRMAWVGFAELDAEKRVRPVAQWGYDEGYLGAAHISWGDTERGCGPTGTAIKTGMPQINQDFATIPSLAPWREEALKRGFRSSTALPLKNEARIFGALTIYSSEQPAFSPEEMLLLQELSDDLAFGIESFRVRSAHNQAMSRLERSMETTIEAVAATLEMRDPYTAGHQKNVAALAVAIARELGVPKEEIRGLRFASMVHDIGKMQIPAEILSKPSRLTEIEYQLIKEHAHAGYQILKDIDFPWPIAEMVLQHHERMDGSGYPRGLKGEAIMLGARILAVADTVEAMAAHRPYRPARGIETALQEIRTNRGKLYDPRVVDACEKIFSAQGFRFET